jgi:RNA polymerase sigma factor (sigma-70 family)
MPAVHRPPTSAEVWIDSPALVALLIRVAAHHRIGSADLDDLAQETRIALWEAGNEVVGAAWVLQVASNKAVDLIRRRARAVARDQTFSTLNKGRPSEPEITLLLHARVAALPPQIREFYELHYVQGWSEREIAAQLGKCRASIRWLDHRCRQSIIGEGQRSIGPMPGNDVSATKAAVAPDSSAFVASGA